MSFFFFFFYKAVALLDRGLATSNYDRRGPDM
jgi:hypothetical protein